MSADKTLKMTPEFSAIKDGVKAIVAEQQYSKSIYDKEQDVRIKKIAKIIEGADIELVRDNELYKTIDELNNILCSASEDFNFGFSVQERRNKLVMTVTNWQSSYC